MSLSAQDTAINKLRVMGAINTKGMTPHERNQRVWGTVYSSELGWGTQFIITKPDKRLYMILGKTQEILALPPSGRGGDRVFGYLYQMYGLDRTSRIAACIYEQFRTTAINEGIHVEMRRFAAFDQETKTTYLSSYDGQMWRIDGETPKKIPSGDEGVFFLDDDGGVPVEPDIADHGILLDALTKLNYEVGPAGITAEQQRKFTIVWMFAQAFPDLLPDKPVMLLEGIKGSGKTSAALLIQLALTGVYRVMSISNDQSKDFGVLLLRTPIAILDNMDTFIDWLQDQIARYCTMGTFPRRRLFSDDEEILVKPNSFVAITSRNPSTFRRDDVVDRLLIVRLKRYSQGFKTAKRIIAEITENRSRLLGEYIFHVNRIVQAIRAGAINEERVEQWRMASFASFTRLVGKVFEWTDEEVQDMLDAMQGERDVFEGEGDPLVEIMQEWIAYRARGEPPNIGREFSLVDLFRIYSNLAKAKEILFYKHQSRLADKLASSYVARHFRVDMRYDEKTGSKFYRIWRHTDPDLSVVEEERIEITEPKVRIITKTV